MKTIGLLGGMSWESTTNYYQAINQGIKHRLGGLHSAKLVLYSVDFAEKETLQHAGDWQQTANILTKAAKNIEAGGADFMLIGTNTMHKVAEQISASLTIPLLHIADATARQLQTDGINRVGLLGTKFTMSQEFYKSRLTEKFNIEVIVPSEDDQEIIHNVIYQELCLGIVNDDSRAQFLNIIDKLTKLGAQAVVLGCTEIAMLVQSKYTDTPLYETAEIHAKAAVDLALER